MSEEIYGSCANCGGPLVAGHQCANMTKEIAKLAVDTARGMKTLGLSPAPRRGQLRFRRVFRADLGDRFGVLLAGSEVHLGYAVLEVYGELPQAEGYDGPTLEGWTPVPLVKL